MKSEIKIVAMALLSAIWFGGCNKSNTKENDQPVIVKEDTKEQKKQKDEEKTAVKETFTSQREKVVERLADLKQKVDNERRDLRARSVNAKGDAKIAYRKIENKLDLWSTKMEVKIKEGEEVTEENWAKMKAELERLADDVEASLQEAKEDIKALFEKNKDKKDKYEEDDDELEGDEAI